MALWANTAWVPPLPRVVAILWISFVMAGAATGAFFSLIDPLELKYCVSFPETSRIGAYTVGFLLFWLLTGASCLFTTFFLYPPKPAEDVNTTSAQDPR